jgi:hypothetical protein
MTINDDMSFETLRQFMMNLQKQSVSYHSEKIHKSLFLTSNYIERINKSAKGKDSVWISNASFEGTRYGHIGSGGKNVLRKPGRPTGTGKGLTPVTGLHSGKIDSSNTSGKKSQKSSQENLKDHSEMKIGSFVKVHHPHKHQFAQWAKVLDIGNDGVFVEERNGNRCRIRWEDVHEVKPKIDDTPDNILELAKLSVPISGNPITSDHYADSLAELRRNGAKLHHDLINDKSKLKKEVYSHLIDEDAPIDPVSASMMEKTDFNSGIINDLIKEALSSGSPIDPEMIVKLPKQQILDVLTHHFAQIEKLRS